MTLVDREIDMCGKQSGQRVLRAGCGAESLRNAEPATLAAPRDRGDQQVDLGIEVVVHIRACRSCSLTDVLGIDCLISTLVEHPNCFGQQEFTSGYNNGQG